MKYGIVIGAVLLASVAGWATAQTNVRQRPAPATPLVMTVDQVSLLSARVQQLQTQVQDLQTRMQTMETANQIQGGTILELQAFRVSTNGALAGINQKQTTLQQRFDTHTHDYNYPHIVWNNRSFVTESHVSGDDKDMASYISVWVPMQETTGVPK